MEKLSDDILLRVLQNVDTEQLVGEVRAVCRKWRQLALHPLVWEHRSVSTDLLEAPQSKTVFSRVLTVAPCLKKLHIDDLVMCPDKNPHLADLVRTTLCATRELTVDAEHFDIAKQTLENQVARGRLCRLILGGRGDGVVGILHVIRDLHLDEVSLLVRTRVTGDLGLKTTGFNKWGEGSIRRLAYRTGWSDDLLLEFLLRTRSRSLEYVEIFFETAPSLLSAPLVNHLGHCVNLKTVELKPAVMELACLSDCQKLTSLDLVLQVNKGLGSSAVAVALTASLTHYFRSAPAARLTQLTLSCAAANERCLPMECLFALAVSRSSALEELSLHLCSAGDSEQLDQLALVMLGFQHLRHLTLNRKPSVKLMDCICPGNAPSLRLLTLCSCTPVSTCDWVELMRLVRRIRQLEVQMATCGSCAHGRAAPGTYPGRIRVYRDEACRDREEVIVSFLEEHND